MESEQPVRGRVKVVARTARRVVRILARVSLGTSLDKTMTMLDRMMIRHLQMIQMELPTCISRLTAGVHGRKTSAPCSIGSRFPYSIERPETFSGALKVVG
jgi:hypothetical protein